MTTFALRTLTEKKTPTPALAVACVDSWLINVPGEAWLIDRIVQDTAEGHGGTVFTINLDHLSKLRTDGAFRAAYEHASYISADGVPVVLLARATGADIERVTGADLVLPLCRAAASAGIPVHFFGARADVLERAVTRLRREEPGLTVAGREAPPMDFDPRDDAARAAALRIAASGARICFVALGAPKQEIFADAARGWTEGVVFLGVGAAFDFLAGERRRAPRMLQRVGLEWAWRAAQDPRRLLPRYLRSAVWLMRYLLRARPGIRGDHRPSGGVAPETHGTAKPVSPTPLTPHGR